MSIINSFPHAICMQSVVVLVQRSCRTEQSVDILRIEQKLASQINKYRLIISPSKHCNETRN